MPGAALARNEQGDDLGVYRRYRNKSTLLDELFEDRIDELARLAERSLEHPDAWQAFADFLERVTDPSPPTGSWRTLSFAPTTARSASSRVTSR